MASEPACQRSEVTEAQAIRRSEEQSRERRRVVGATQDAQPGVEVGDLGDVEQAAERCDLDRDPAAFEGLAHEDDLPVTAEQHRDVSPLEVRRFVQAVDALGDPFGLIDGGSEAGDLHPALVGRFECSEPFDAAASDLSTNALGEVDDRVPRSAIHAQGGVGRRLPGRGGEVVGESREVPQGRAAPLIDRLVGVSDGGHREPVAEEGAEELALCRVRVLVLVEEDDPVAASEACGDRRMLGHDPMGEPNEVAVVHEPEAPLPLFVGGECRGEGAPSRRCLCRVGPVREIRRVSEMVAETGGKRCELSHPRRSVAEIQRGIVDGACGFGEQLAGRTGRQDRRIPPHSHDRPELTKDPVREAVIRRDLDASTVPCVIGELESEPFCEFLGGLVREGDAESLFGLETAGPDECRQPLRHRGRLPGAGAGDDSQRLEGVADDGLLFGTRLEGVHRENASRPSGHSGHTCFTAQRSQVRERTGVQSSVRRAWAISSRRAPTSSS